MKKIYKKLIGKHKWLKSNHRDKQADKSVVMKKTIKSSSTATFGDAAAAVTRIRLAVEGAAKKNIELGLQEISSLSL